MDNATSSFLDETNDSIKKEDMVNHTPVFLSTELDTTSSSSSTVLSKSISSSNKNAQDYH